MIIKPKYYGPQFWDGGKSLDLYFARDKSLDPRITFTRASSGTYFDASGVLQTATTDEPRFDHNPVTGESLGLLVEGAATNLVLNSAAMATQNVSVSAVVHTLSFYGTGTVTLSGASTAGPLVGSGAKVLSSLTFTPSAGTLTLTVSGSVEYGQLETDSRASSRIITLGSTVTRAADSASMTGTNFSSWYNPAEGTFVVEVSEDYSTTVDSRGWMTAHDGALTNSINMYHSGGSLALDFYSGGAQQVAFNPTYNTKAAIAYKTNESAGSAGGSIATDSVCVVPSGINQMIIGSTYAGNTYPMNGCIKRLTYYPRRLTNGNLQELTS